MLTFPNYLFLPQRTLFSLLLLACGQLEEMARVPISYLFTFSIQSRGSLIKEQDLWITDQSSSNGYSLFLSSGNQSTFVTH